MKTKTIIMIMVLAVQALTMNGQSRFYNSKSMIVGLTSNNNVFYSAGLGSKTFSNKIPRFDISVRLNGNEFDSEGTVRQMNEMQIGKKVLDLLFEREKGKLSEDLLRRRAWENVQLTDRERAAIGTYSPELILKEDILPILESNYILLTHDFDRRTKTTFGAQTGEKFKTAWIVLHVDIDQSTWDEVNANWKNLKKYDRINVNVSYVASGVAKENTSLYTTNDHEYSGLIRDLAKKAPALAVRGQIISRSPYKAALGTDNGVKPCWDLVRIFRQSINSQGQFESKEIGKARVLKADKEECALRTVAGKTGSVENGDMAVLMPVKRTGRSLGFQWRDNLYSLRYDFDININMGGPLMFHYHEIDLRLGMRTNGKNEITGLKEDRIGNAYFAGIGTGPGLGLLFFKGCELEAYGMLQAEGWLCSTKDGYGFIVEDNEDPKETLTGLYLRCPIGLRLQANIKYPLRIFGGVEYGFSFLNSNKDMEKCVFEPQDWKRDGLEFFVGLKYAF